MVTNKRMRKSGVELPTAQCRLPERLTPTAPSPDQLQAQSEQNRKLVLPSTALPPQKDANAAAASQSKIPFMIIFVPSVIVVSAVCIVVFIAKTMLSDVRSHSCASETCIYGEFLINSLNHRTSPCDDFGSYVCSTITAGNTLQWNFKYNPSYLWARQKSDYLARSNFKDAPWMTSAANVYESCVNRIGENERENLADLVSFMKSLRLAWPHNLDDKSHPLDVALELAIRWDMPFWFKVRLLQKTTTKPRRIYLSHGTYTTFWMEQYKELRKLHRYSNYVENYLDLFSVNLTVNMKQVEDHLETTSDVLTSLHNAAFRKHKNATVVSIDDLDKLLPAGNDSSWTALLNKHFNHTPPFTPNETVLLSDTEILEVIVRLLAKYGSDTMMHQLAWWFVQSYTVIASDVAFALKFGTKPSANIMKPLFCLTQVESFYQWPLIADHVKVRFAQNETNAIDTLLRNIVEAAVAKVHEASWIDNGSKETAVEKIISLSINLWPEALHSAKINWSAVSLGHSLVKNWIYGHELRASLLGTEYYYESTRLAHNVRDPPLHYDYLLNEVTLAMLTTEKPFYIHKASSTLNYAGLGSAFARVLVEAFDPVGIMHFRGGSPKRWLSANTSVEFMKRANCKEAGFEGSIFPEIPGLEVAFQAFQDERRVSGGGSVNSMGFDDNKMFFIQFCHVMCVMNQTSLGSGCNLALRNFEPFADAFSCAPGTRMNPNRKCFFF